MVIFVNIALIEHPWVQDQVHLLISFPQSFVLALFQVQELVLHINSLFVLNENDFIVRVVSLVLEATKLTHIDLLLPQFLVHLHSVQFQLFCVFEGNELLG